MDASEIAGKMLEILHDGDQWAQGHLEVSGGFDYEPPFLIARQPRRCLLGARALADGLRYRYMGEVTDALRGDEYIARLAAVIREQFPDRVARLKEEWSWVNLNDPSELVVRFNDHGTTTYPDIRLILEKAAAE